MLGVELQRLVEGGGDGSLAGRAEGVLGHRLGGLRYIPVSLLFGETLLFAGEDVVET